MFGSRLIGIVVSIAVTGILTPSLSAEPHDTADWVGTNYTPAYAVNQVQLWHDFRPDVIEKELVAAKHYFGITTLRVYLHNIPYDAEKEKFLDRIEQFLVICERHGIRPGFTFFDDCHRHEGIFLEEPTEPVKGYHNGRWAACPQDRERTEENLPKFKAYIQDVIRPHRGDPRVLWWETFNEPNMRLEYSRNLRTLGYAWAKEVEPSQPVICCWDESPETDIVNAHNYSNDRGRWDKQTELNPAKGAVFTEAGARWCAPRPSNGEPVEVVHWLQCRKSAGKYVPGVYLCWELMVGNSNCRWYWGTPEGTPEPTVPWCGLMWPDATPVSLAESEAIRRYTTGETRAMLFDDFQEQNAPSSIVPSGWKKYGGAGQGFSGVLELEPAAKMIAGSEDWTDYVLEAVVMLKDGTSNAGLVFRTTEPGPGYDQMRGYYVGFDTKTLHLGKIENNWQPLAKFDLSQLDCKVVPGVWNQMRIAVQGPRIRVWFDQMHPSADKDRGLRIDFTDPNPILAGAIGFRTLGVPAWYDNVVVLPINSFTTQKDVAYDDADPAQKLDVYLAASDKPMPTMVFIHGGGWRGGSKNRVPGWLMNAVRGGWLSVVSVEYRFTNVAAHPAQVNDCMRAIQFVRHNAAKWNIDPQRIGVTGGSAGGHLTLWVALHDDVADDSSSDPVERQSSRVACAVSFAGPTDWGLLGKLEHKHPAYRQLLGSEPGTPADQMDAKAKKDVSPISFASEDDPPVMQVHGDKDRTVPIQHAKNMHERLQQVGVKSELVIIEDANHGVAGAGPAVAKRATVFVRKQLNIASKPK